MKRVSFVLMIALALATAPAAIAQQLQGTTTVQTPPPGQGRSTTTVSNAGQQGLDASMTNVRLELIILDQTVGGQPIKKAVTLVLAERGSGRVRSSANYYRRATEENPTTGFETVTLNADASIMNVVGDRLRAHITVEYAPARSPTSGPVPPAGTVVGFMAGSPLNQTVDVILTVGKPLVIVQAADPLTDRKVTLEVTATIVR